ncbi:MAG: chorismate lyase [Pseudomonadota bacterium]
MRAWLRAPGSLTARLRAHGLVEIQVQHQGSQALWAPEQHDLHCLSGHVREVVLLLDGMPVVWARSATSHRALKGPWKALTGLGNRPLAELLFLGRHVCREPLQTHHVPRHGRIEQRLHAAWQQLHPDQPDAATPRWARSSVFWRDGQPLRVMEAFAPWITRLDADRSPMPYTCTHAFFTPY